MPATPKPKPPIHNKYTVTISAQLGDRIQELALESILSVLVDELEQNLNRKHDKNMIVCEIDKQPIDEQKTKKS